MPSTTLTIQVDQDLKDQAGAILENLGLDLTFAVNAFLNAVVRTQGMPLTLDLSTIPNGTTLAAIEEGEKLLRDPTTPRYHDMASLKSALESPDSTSFLKL